MALDNVVDSSASQASQDCERRPRFVEVSDQQLQREWDEMLDIAGRQNAFLDSVHILAIAHALRRPIVVIADPIHRDPFGVPLTPVFLRGIYVPFEIPPNQCCRQPLILCFQDAHFMALVPQRSSKPCRIPLADDSGDPYPLRFAMENEDVKRWQIVNQYLDLERDTPFMKAKITCTVAVLQRAKMHVQVEEMLQHFVDRGKAVFETDLAEAEKAALGRDQKQKQNIESVSKRRRLTGRNEDETGESGESDAKVSHKFEVRLPSQARRGDCNHFLFPEGCTDPPKVDFMVPEGCCGGDTIVLNATFKIKGKCVAQFREVTGAPREDAVRSLTQALGDPNLAAQNHFESIGGS